MGRDPSGYSDGLNLFAMYQSMRGGLDPSGLWFKVGSFVRMAVHIPRFDFSNAIRIAPRAPSRVHRIAAVVDRLFVVVAGGLVVVEGVLVPLQKEGRWRNFMMLGGLEQREKYGEQIGECLDKGVPYDRSYNCIRLRSWL